MDDGNPPSADLPRFMRISLRHRVIAFMTTSRQSDDAVTRVPEWDKTRPAPKAK